jgi:biopolymer transport protein ExbB/TolQ
MCRSVRMGRRSRFPKESERLMALTPSHRPTREWPLLVLTLALVGAVCLPLWQWLSSADVTTSGWATWTGERWGRLLLGPEQIVCYCCSTWAAFILLSRYLENRRQRRAFHLPLLPTEEGARILQEDARPLQRRIDQIADQHGPFILANMIRVALAKFSLSRNTQDVSESVRTQAEVEQGRMVTGLSMVHYLAWAIPAVGFLGTVRGLAGTISTAGQVDQNFLDQATQHLGHAFDCTLVALTLSLAVMFLIHFVQREEEALVIDCQQYCLENLVNRIYEPESMGESANMVFAPAVGHVSNVPARDPGHTPVWQPMSLSPAERLPR